jgi:hypothetical protein
VTLVEKILEYRGYNWQDKVIRQQLQIAERISDDSIDAAFAEVNAKESMEVMTTVEPIEQAAVVVPEYETPAHEEIDLATADDLLMQLDPFANEADARLMDAIAEAKRAATAAQASELAAICNEILGVKVYPTTILEWALWCAARQWFVFPCDPIGKEPAGELVPNGVLDATTDEAVIRSWFAKNPNLNYGVALGPSNLVVWDYDIVAPYANMPPTFRVRSGRILKDGEQGGFHDYYQGSCKTHSLFAEPALPITEREELNKKGEKKTVKYDALGRKVGKHGVTVGEIRSRGAYVVGPGCAHKSGRAYVVNVDIPLAVSPEQNAEEIRESGPAAGTELQNKIAGYVEDAFNKSGIDYKTRVAYRGGLMWLIDCPWEHEHSGGKDIRNGGSSSAMFMMPSGALAYKCQHAHCEERDWKELRSYMEQKVGQLQFAPSTGAIEFTQPTAAQQQAVEASNEALNSEVDTYAMTEEEMAVELEKEYPVVPLLMPGGPTWDNDVLYGPLGAMTRKACASSEAHPAGVFLDLIVSLGNIFGRSAYFTVDAKRHHTNEFFIRVGRTAKSRKGTARAIADNILGMVDPVWHHDRIQSGFGSAESIVHAIRDGGQQKVSTKKKGDITFQIVAVPGVDDKRLCIREDEAASIFVLAGKTEGRADIVIRDGWDGSPCRNIVKGQNQIGLSNSAVCMEPHISISADTTASELIRKMPDGSEENGFGNRFLYCYVQRLQKCPMGSPPMDWSQEIVYLHEVMAFAREQRYMPLSRSASRMFKSLYMDSSLEISGLAGKMTDRAIPHIRRIAMILALVDKSAVVESCHVKAARALWDYCQESAEYIFSGSTKDQRGILGYVRKQSTLGPVTVSMLREDLYKRHRKAEWIRGQVTELVRAGRLVETDGILKMP